MHVEDDDLKPFDTKELPAGANTCRQCFCPVTETEQHRQAGRLGQAGYDHEQIERLTPRCRRCVSKLLRTVGKAQPWRPRWESQ